MKLKKYQTTILVICCITLVFVSCKKKDHKNKFSYNYQQDSAKTGDSINGGTTTTSGTTGQKSVNPYYTPQYVEITGYVRNGGGANVAFDQIGIGEILPLNSIIIDDNGNFKLQTMIPEPGLYQLRFTNGMIHMYLRGGKVDIKTDISNLGQYQITGSSESMQLKDMYNLLNVYNNMVDNVQHRIDDLAKDKTRTRELIRVVDSQEIYYARISEKKSKALQKFISGLDTSAIALLATFYLEPNENYRFVMGMLKKFSKKSPHCKAYMQLDDKMKKIVPTNIGDFAPDLTINNSAGIPARLNSYRGKNVLIYFWTSTDQTCRDFNTKLLTIYNRYRSAGFEVFAVSLDESKQSWLKAIKEDNLSWVNVSNLAGMNDEIAQNMYKVNKIPFTMLLDKQGKIVAKGLSSETLPTWLQKLP